jgi:LysR family transcriptional regulator, regulator for metE and metH
VTVRPVFSDEMVIVVDPHHPLATRPYLTAADVATETLLMYSPKENSTIYKLLAAEGAVPANTHVIQLTEAIVEMVKAGLGLAFLARWAVEPQLRAGALRAVPYTRRGYRRTWGAATLKDMARVPYIREFIDLLADHPPFQQNGRRRPTKVGIKVR